ncbi:hypothetical protein PMAC_003055 [Pneumocystis sp. 'macacae']|nr:hypothetical protein PMAC_003055 [Pneumocystis sp. 'macacae']
MKQKLNILDLKSVVSELQKLIGLRLQNIYDISERIFQFKFSASGRKEYLLVESGSRIHLTCYVRETATLPSQFCAKLRKHLKSKRLVSLKQINTDRIVYFGFGGGSEAIESFKPYYYLIFEFYAAGNILLTDSDMKILSLLRFVRPGAMHQQFSVGQLYQITPALSQNRQIEKMTKDALLSLIKALKDKYLSLNEESISEKMLLPASFKRTSKKEKKPRELPLKKLVSWELSNYGNALIEHIIRDANIDPDMKIDEFYRNIETINLDHLLLSFQKADDLIKKCEEGFVTGYIVQKIESKTKFNLNDITEESAPDSTRIYIDFNPFIPKQYSNNPNYSIIAFDNGYNSCIDKYFSSLESQKFDMKLKNQEDIAYRRLQITKEEHQKKIDDLQEFQSICIKKAKAIEKNQEIVDETIKAVNTCILQSMDWEDIAKLIKTEKEYGNPAAEIILLPLKLDSNTITIKLPCSYSNDSIYGDDLVSDLLNNQRDQMETLNIDIKLSLNAWTNARDYYEKKKAASIKEEKTIAASSKALKNAERKIKSDLKRNTAQEKKKIVPMRNLQWFEKFLWFISSDGYLVLAGHDLLQNRILIQNHFSKNDIYVHADLEDAAVVIIKNTLDLSFIPPSTLNQAGAFSIAKSNAWTNKIVTSAWWVYYDQVLKIEDECSTTGTFTIQGKKNFLPPSQLILGYGILWTIDEVSKTRRFENKLSRNNENDLLVHMISNEEVISVAEEIADFSFNDKEQKISINNLKINGDNFDKSNNCENLSINLKDTLTETIQKVKNEDKYDIEEYVEPLVSNNQIISDICASYEKIRKKRISIKERRDMKNMRIKKTQLSEHNEKTNQDFKEYDIDCNQNNLNSEQIYPSKLNERNTSLLSTSVRGKKGKLKKIMLKYADQDEDDRALRMELLGSNKPSKKKEKLEDKNKKKVVIDKNVKKLSQKSNCNNKQTILQNDFEKKNIFLQKKENFHIFNNKKDYEINLDSFISFPLPDDILIEAIPVCAPYSSMAKYKYKIKLQPGSTKKGKAIRSILAYWDSLPVDPYLSDKEKAFPKEKELIHSLRDSELLSPLCVSSLDSTGNRLFAKYCQSPHEIPQAGYVHPNLYPTVKEQRIFEKGLWEKTKKTNNDVILYENHTVVYKSSVDITIYVIGGQDENELILYEVLTTLKDTLEMLFKMLIDKHVLLENYDLLSLAVNEICDDGIIVETEPSVIVSRISRPSFSDGIVQVDLSEKGLINAYQMAKEKLAERILKGNI